MTGGRMWGKIDKTKMVLLQIWNKDVCKISSEVMLQIWNKDVCTNME